MNGTHDLRIDAAYRDISEVYEPELWRQVMSSLRPGDTIADVGAFIGLYSIAMAKQVAPIGHVFAFEPDPQNRRGLERNIVLNSVKERISVAPFAVGARRQTVQFSAGQSSESSVARDGSISVDQITLDDFFERKGVDVLKVDVEGYEAEVLRGARSLLLDKERRPRSVFIEVHPYAWAQLELEANDFVGVIQDCGYELFTLTGEPAISLDRLGWVVARPL
jgi:FkbM family methyltransferase